MSLSHPCLLLTYKPPHPLVCLRVPESGPLPNWDSLILPQHSFIGKQTQLVITYRRSSQGAHKTNYSLSAVGSQLCALWTRPFAMWSSLLRRQLFFFCSTSPFFSCNPFSINAETNIWPPVGLSLLVFTPQVFKVNPRSFVAVVGWPLLLCSPGLC